MFTLKITMPVSTMLTPKKLSLTATLLGSVLLFGGCNPSVSESSQDGQDNAIESAADAKSADSDNKPSKQPACQNDLIVETFNAQRSDVQVKGCGTVVKVLADDNEGSRHQKFLLKLTPATESNRKLTLLIAHNIDLAPRIANLKSGDEVSFYGEYEFNPKGGVIHWTHHDPAARHQHGWLERAGQRYE